MYHLANNHGRLDTYNYLEIFLRNKAPDCIIYSEDGAEFKTHKELFGQTKFMRELLKSQSCCGIMEVRLIEGSTLIGKVNFYLSIKKSVT